MVRRLLAGFLTIGFAPPAQALPSFARQTGQPCGTCHTDFPALDPVTAAGSSCSATRPAAANSGRRRSRAIRPMMRGRTRAARLCARIDGKGDAATQARADKDYVPPISMMAIVGYTHTQVPLAPPTDPYSANDNIVLSPFSGFWGGAITDNIGAFVAGHLQRGARRRIWRSVRAHLDVGQHRCPLRQDRDIGAVDLIYGITANNNPTVQDVVEHHAGVVIPVCGSTLAHSPRHDADRGRVRRACRWRRRLHADQRHALSRTDRLPDTRFSQQNSVGVDPFARPACSAAWRLIGGSRSSRTGVRTPYGRHLRHDLRCQSMDRQHASHRDRPERCRSQQIHRRRRRLAVPVSGRIIG